MPIIFGTYFIYRYGGAVGLRLHFARFIKWRFKPAYWLFAVLAMPLVATTTTVVYSYAVDPIIASGWARLMDGSVMSASLERYNDNAYESIGFFTTINSWMATSAAAFIVGSLLLGFVDGGISEEPGWRGFAYPILQDRWGALPAALLIGLVWAGWHLGPRQWAILFGQGGDAFLAFLPGYAATYILGVTPLAIIFAWLYENTGGSLLAVFMVHNSFNQTSTTFGFMFPDAPIMLGVIAFLWLMVIFILVTCDWRAFGRARTRRTPPTE
jgi:membrane protease YdiL (CAAX protease family)